LCIILNLLKDKLLGQSMSIGATQVLPQRGHATIVVAQPISPGIAPLRGVVVPSMHPGPITLYLKHSARKPSHNKLLSGAVSTTPPLRKFRRMPKSSWVCS